MILDKTVQPNQQCFSFVPRRGKKGGGVRMYKNVCGVVVRKKLDSLPEMKVDDIIELVSTFVFSGVVIQEDKAFFRDSVK